MINNPEIPMITQRVKRHFEKTELKMFVFNDVDLIRYITFAINVESAEMAIIQSLRESNPPFSEDEIIDLNLVPERKSGYDIEDWNVVVLD